MISPRDYQQRAVEAVFHAWREGKKAPLVVAPAGAGKTTIGAMVALRESSYSHDGRGIAWGAHRGELVDQAVERLEAVGLDVGARGLGEAKWAQVGTYQTWCRRGKVPAAAVFIPDEAHHLADTNDWTRVLRIYLESGTRVVGLTATPARADDQSLHGFDHIITATTIPELVAARHLVPVVWRGPSRAMAAGKVARSPAEAYRIHARGRSAVVFAPNVPSAEAFAKEFQADGVRAAVVSTRTPDDERYRILRDLANGDIQVVCNKDVLTEGWDCPRVSCVIVARRTASQSLWIQMTGRGLRPFPGKSDCLLLDCCGLAHSLGRPDDDRTYHLDGDGIRLVNPPAVPAGVRLCKVCGTPLEGLKCSECGQDHSQNVPKSTGEEMGEWLERYSAAKALLQPSRTVLCLAGIMRKALEAAQSGKPWARGAVQARFRSIMKRTPYGDEWRQAVELNEISLNGIASALRMR